MKYLRVWAVTLTCSWSSICRIVAFVEDDRYEELMAKKAACQLTRFGDVTGVCEQV